MLCHRNEVAFIFEYDHCDHFVSFLRAKPYHSVCLKLPYKRTLPESILGADRVSGMYPLLSTLDLPTEIRRFIHTRDGYTMTGRKESGAVLIGSTGTESAEPG